MCDLVKHSRLGEGRSNAVLQCIDQLWYMVANSDDWEKAGLMLFFNVFINCGIWWLIVMIGRRLV